MRKIHLGISLRDGMWVILGNSLPFGRGAGGCRGGANPWVRNNPYLPYVIVSDILIVRKIFYCCNTNDSGSLTAGMVLVNDKVSTRIGSLRVLAVQVLHFNL